MFGHFASSLRALALISLASIGASTVARAQQPLVACDFDIADDLGRFVFGNTMHLTGQPGAGTNLGEFIIINGSIPEQDVDRDGYAPTVGRPTHPNCASAAYSNLQLAITQLRDLVNVENPAIVIPARNIFLQSLPRTLAHGANARVTVNVELPNGTPAGRYIGQIEIRDSVQRPYINATTREEMSLDRLAIEVIVTEQRAFTVLESATSEELDSVVIRARAGSRGSTSLRIANAGNAPLGDVRLSATDLRSESAVGLTIPAQNVLFSVSGFSGLGLTDTATVTVTVNVPRGILGGRYRGSILVQGFDTPSATIPLIVIVTSSRGILFSNNPVRGVVNGVATIAFNGDPGTAFQVGIFDMSGLQVFVQSGSVFAGIGGTNASPTAGADFAAAINWPLINMRGENVASGMYLVVVESVVLGKRQQASDRLMVIR